MWTHSCNNASVLVFGCGRMHARCHACFWFCNHSILSSLWLAKNPEAVADIDGAEIFSGVESIAYALRDLRANYIVPWWLRSIHAPHLLFLCLDFFVMAFVQEQGLHVAVADICHGSFFDVTTSAGFLYLALPLFFALRWCHVPWYSMFVGLFKANCTWQLPGLTFFFGTFLWNGLGGFF